MKYCVFTSKYHDGFAMFDTSYDDYVFYNWPEYSMGKRNFRAGMRPPLCGYVANPYKDSNGSWIRTKLWACMARGHPETAGEFFDRIQEKVKSAKHVPAWDGELYLEYHRGTYTTHAYNKKQNRKIEYALCETEWLQLL